MKKLFIIIIAILIVAAGAALFWKYYQSSTVGPSPIYGGNAAKKENLIRLFEPAPNQKLTSPLVIKGEARGYWFFEASFPVILTNWDGLIIAQGIATAQDEWMTEEFVPFTATLQFDYPTYKDSGALILKKDNPSGLPEHDDALEIPVVFAKIRQ